MSGKYDLKINQGETLSRVLTWKDSSGNPIDLTSFTARMQGRVSPDASATLFELTTANSGITLGGTAGTITLSMTAAATAALSEGTGFYDLELISGGGVVTRLLQGNLIISREITR
jgi:hypothetical protein